MLETMAATIPMTRAKAGVIRRLADAPIATPPANVAFCIASKECVADRERSG